MERSYVLQCQLIEERGNVATNQSEPNPNANQSQVQASKQDVASAFLEHGSASFEWGGPSEASGVDANEKGGKESAQAVDKVKSVGVLAAELDSTLEIVDELVSDRGCQERCRNFIEPGSTHI